MYSRQRPPRPPPARRGPREWWRWLGGWGRISLAGLALAGVLAIFLAWAIPRRVGTEFLDVQAEADRAVVQALVSSDVFGAGEGSDLNTAALDEFARHVIEQEGFVRVKLWDLEGTILYSDEPRLIGRTFPEEADEGHHSGETGAHRTNLQAAENVYERDLGDELLELYLPIERDGETVAVWEVYRSLDNFDGATSDVRRSVWWSVGTGLTILAIFLASTLGSLVLTAQRRRDEAEIRSAELSGLLELSHSIAGNPQPTALAMEAVQLLRSSTGLRALSLVRIGETREVVAADGDPACARAEATGAEHKDTELMERVALPGDDLVLVGCRAAPPGPDDRVAEIMRAAGEQIRVGMENADLIQSLEAARLLERRLTGRLVSAQEEERKRVVGEIHDGLGQDLHRVLFGIRGSQGAAEHEVHAELQRLEELVDQSSRRLRSLLQDLRPTIIDDVGLRASLRSLADRVETTDGLKVSLQLADIPEPPIPVRVAIFRIVQEALQNVRKHAGVREAAVELKVEHGDLVARISDAGVGKQGEVSDDQLGMWLMAERAESIGGNLETSFGPEGTTVMVHVPLARMADPEGSSDA